MDLSQQELPLTSYFTRSSKEATPRTVPSAAPTSKRAAGHSKLRPTTLQLPTPATSSRKRMRSGRLRELPGEKQLAAEQNAILQSEDNLAQPELEPTHPKLPQSSCGSAEDIVPSLSRVPIATPSTDGRKPTKPMSLELSTGSSGHTVPDIVTPRTSLRRKSASEHSNSLARSDRPNSTRSSQRSPDSGVPQTVCPRVEHFSSSTAGFPADSDSPDPFCAHGQGRDLFAPKQYLNKPSDGHAIPMVPVSSSQSQYLLSLDATPKRKRCPRRAECVASSQTQEERELVLSTPHKRIPTAVGRFSTVSPGKRARGNVQTPRERTSQQVRTLGFASVGLSINSTAGPSHSSFVANVLSNEAPPSRRESHSPSCSKKTPRKSRRDSIEDIPPVDVEDSLTEPESDPDILSLRTRNKLSTFGQSLQGVNCSPRRPLVVRDPCRQGSLHGMEDDSATEAESDTEILRCIAQIGKKRSRAHCSEVSRKDTPPPPVISPLVSPARSRVAVMPSIVGCTQFPSQGGVASSASRSCVSRPLGIEQLRMPSESLPSVVRDFIHMFPGDESYPADFPEYLRV